MKRLLLSLTAALALGAYADTGDYSYTGFEALEAGTALDITKDDAGGDTARFWAGDGDEYGVISNHIGAVEVAGLNGQNKYLKFEADGTLYRYALDNQQEDRTIDVSGMAGIYFDSLVQFTGSEEIMDINVGDRAKLAVWLYQCDTEDGAFGIGTNLVVTAGYLDAENGVTVSNYVTNLELAEGWHRLTVKMIPEIGADTGVAGFVVFVDGVAVANADAKGDAGSAMDNLNATAAKWAEKNALFPTMITKGEDKQTFECVGFKGQGALDELLVTANAPAFAADGTIFTLNWDAGLASLTIDGEPVDSFVAGEKGTTNINVTAGTPTYEVLATAQAGYNLGERVAEGGVVKSGDNGFKVNGTGIGTIVVNQAKFIVNGQPYSTLADAIAAAGKGGMVKLGADLTEKIKLDNNQDFVLDLAGKKITYIGTDASPIEVASAKLKIIDTVGGGVITGSEEMGSLYVGESGEVIVGDAEATDKGATFIGEASAEDGILLVVRGKFDITSNSELADYKDPASDISESDGYYVVTPSTGKTYPDYIPDVDEIKEKFDIWADEKNGGNRDVSGEDLDAFLLNCAPDQVDVEKAKFKITSITQDEDGNWVVTACDKGQNEVYGNGYVNIISVKADKFPTAGEGADFFQATLTIQPTLK